MNLRMSPKEHAETKKNNWNYSRRTKFLNGRFNDLVLGITTTAALLLLWELLSQLGVVDSRFFPAPSKILRHMVEQYVSGRMLFDVRVSLVRLFLGTLLGGLPALGLGLTMGLFRPIRAALSPLVNATYPIPKSAIYPLVLLFFGLGETSKIVAIAIGVFFPIVMNTITGVINILPIYHDVGSNFGASGWKLFRTVALPGAMANIVTGINLGIGIGLIMVVVVEMTNAQEGLGYLIWNSWQTFAVETMYAALITIGLLGIAITALIGFIQKFVMPWQS